jgi:AmmeMemoRadiSam system protein A
VFALAPLQDGSPARGATLLALARDAIARHLEVGAVPWADGAWLAEPGATFVTLRTQGELRGCVGSLEARRALREDVPANAVAAAFHDLRFPPLAAGEWGALRVEVSELSAATPLPFAAEDELRAALRPGVDGLILDHRGRRATFLPQVWEQLPDPADFLRHLKLKAGLPPCELASDARAFRDEVVTWAECEVTP